MYLTGRILLLTLLLAPLMAWVTSTGFFTVYNPEAAPPGQAFYLFSKLFALYAMFALWYQLITTLVKRLQLSSFVPLFPRWSYDSHRIIGSITLGLSLAHFFLFFVAVTIRKQQIAFDLFIPILDHGYYRTGVSIGLMALAGLTIVPLAAHFRNCWPTQWRWLHRMAYGAFIAGAIHGLMIGSESRTGAFWGVYLFYFGSVVALLFYYLADRLRPQREGVQM